MLRRAVRLSSVARAAAARQLGQAVPLPVGPAVPQSVSEISAGWKAPSLLRFQSSAPATPAPAASGEIALEIDHATGLEREELVGEVEGKPRFELSPPQGPFGTAEAPAIIESYFDERLVGCSGGIGEEEHDVVWFQLKKSVGHECSVCGQVFQLKVVGAGGLPGQHH